MQSIGELAKEFRKARGWSYTRMAQEVAKHGDGNVSRQAITQLEAAGARKPHYIAALAKVMGTTTDHLLSGAETSQESEPWVAELTGMLAEVPAEDRAGMLAHFRWYIDNFKKTSSPNQPERQEVQSNAPAFNYTKSNQTQAQRGRKQQ